MKVLMPIKVFLTFTSLNMVLLWQLFYLFVPVFKYCYSDSRSLWTVMRAGGLALWNLIQPTISLEMPLPSQGHYGFHSFPVIDWFYEFWLSLCKIVRSSVILLLPLYSYNRLWYSSCSMGQQLWHTFIFFLFGGKQL